MRPKLTGTTLMVLGGYGALIILALAVILLTSG